jgi:hypothetical protein
MPDRCHPSPALLKLVLSSRHAFPHPEVAAEEGQLRGNARRLSYLLHSWEDGENTAEQCTIEEIKLVKMTDAREKAIFAVCTSNKWQTRSDNARICNGHSAI